MSIGGTRKEHRMLRWAVLFFAIGVADAQGVPKLRNSGFEAAASGVDQVPGWTVTRGNRRVLIRIDDSEAKEGNHSLLIETREPVGADVGQELFLPVGSTWMVSVWIKGEAEAGSHDPREARVLQIETPAGNQGKA